MARQARGDFSHSDCTHHCISRTRQCEPLLDNEAKTFLFELICKIARFSLVKLISLQVLSTHFHLLVRVPAKRKSFTDEELLAQYAIIHPPRKVEALRSRLAANPDPAYFERVNLRARLEDISAFMKEVKQRFTAWYNRKYGSIGSVWNERFYNLVVSGMPTALLACSLYIVLNCVRARMVEDPQVYPYSSFYYAARGDPEALAGVCLATGISDPKEAFGYYQALVYQDGLRLIPQAVGKGGRRDPKRAPYRGTIPEETVRRVLKDNPHARGVGPVINVLIHSPETADAKGPLKIELCQAGVESPS